MTVHVRDNRGGNWWWAHNALFDRYGAELGPYPLLIYFCLCRHAGRDQSTWVGQKTLQQQTGTSESTVRRALKALQEAGLVTIHDQVDERGRTTNLYELLDVPLADAPPVLQTGGGVRQNGASGPTERALPFMNKTQRTRGSSPPNASTPTALDDIPANGTHHGNGEIDELWSLALVDLREQILPTNFARWLSRARLRGVEDGEAVIGVPDRVSAEQLAKRFDALVRQALSDACGEPVTVRYEVAAGAG